MDAFLEEIILKTTQAKQIQGYEIIQELWSGYGQILRVNLTGFSKKSIIVKQVKLPQANKHPRGWNTSLSHERKVKSYQVETAWYKDWSARCTAQSPIPNCIALEEHNGEVIIVMEDLNESGYPARKHQVSISEIKTCLSWLAHFHATFMGQTPKGLWEKGTYWHIDTRPDELEALTDQSLKNAAHTIDQLLTESPYQTIVHGDAKLANFCFSEDGTQVAAVDFQYVGKGCGMKDVAYFIGSCLGEEECEQYISVLLDHYFKQLENGLKSNPNVAHTTQQIISNWQKLFPMAWTDFHRFLKGWSPGHWKINSFSERLSQEVIQSIAKGLN